MSKLSPSSRANATTTESSCSSMLTATTRKSPPAPSRRYSRSIDGISTRQGWHRVAAREDRVARYERVRPGRVGRRDGVRSDPSVHLEERARAVRGEQVACPADLVIRGRKVRLPAEPGVHSHDEQQVQVRDDFFR